MSLTDKEFELQFFAEDGVGVPSDVTGGTPGLDTPVSGVKGTEDSIYDAPTDGVVVDQSTDSQQVDGQPDSQGQPVPGEYAEFAFPEDFDRGGSFDAQIGEFKTLAKELNLTQDQAQKLVDFHSKTWIGAIAEADERNTKMIETWAQETKSLPEYGGANFNTSLTHAKRFVDAFGGDELRTALKYTGMANHPVLFKTFTKAGRLLAEHNLVTGGASMRPQKPFETMEEIGAALYGGSK